MRRHRITNLLLLCLGLQLAPAVPARADSLPVTPPETIGLDSQRLAFIDDVVGEGIKRGNMPGCVILIGYQEQIAYLKAFGHRQLKPESVPMTTDTVFDLASLTKPIATATSIMQLIERGLLAQHDPVARYIPEFAVQGKQDVTIEQLLTHQGGLIPDNALDDYLDGPVKAFQRIHDLTLKSEPGTQFIYSDVGFLVLGELIQTITKQNVHEFSQENLFRPLGMTETGFLPEESLRTRAAVTEERNGLWMQGEVHDPRSYALGGIAGHAGLFSTARDLAQYAQMMLNGGILNGTRVLATGSVKLMTTPVEVSSGQRGLGWDIRTGYSSNRGDLFSRQAFGHGGFTGTALWIDPKLQMYVIFLSNRVHPDGKGSVNTIAGRVGTIAAAAIRQL